MAHEIDVQWMGKMQFNALVNGHTIVMDGPEKVGGENTGPIPKPFVLTALAGCTGMDIAAILRKADKKPDDFDIKVIGEISKRAPIEYIAIHVIYEFKGAAENKEAAQHAVTDSQEKYCGVSSMLKKALPVTWEVKYNGVQIFNNKKEDAAELN
ncbi:OsmC family protein [Agriterribacter sp.]|uniref:OsmC family protein n=1 Tax=Agriterribacter sp. TaxID=2821509 RepID=UPI002C351CA1|nr:OsmC family protein [Agriterribacter sp.]HTN09245.1 OsmC family protein [Agriterribacter sp.]